MASLDHLAETFKAAPFGPTGAPQGGVGWTGEGEWPSLYAVTALASGSIGAFGATLARYGSHGSGQGRGPSVSLDRRLASLWFDMTIRPDGWEMPSLWDDVAGNYETADGWVRLHTNAPHHRRAALRALGCEGTRDAVARACRERACEEIETAVVEAGGCAAAMRSEEEWWRGHPQGRAVATEPLVAWDDHGTVEPDGNAVDPDRPLRGVRVLDVTRVLAGPVAGRALAAYGADVLRIDPPGWDEPGVIPEVTLGKRCATLDLKSDRGRARFEDLVREADLLLHGLRPGAMAALGFDGEALRRINPRLLDATLCAWGWTGPWAARRGYDSLVQMACGIAEAGMRATGADRPVPLPVQALDHATGYYLATAAVEALRLRRETGRIATARLSLARTALALMQTGRAGINGDLAPLADDDLAAATERTSWGPARRVRWPLEIDGMPARWPNGARALHTDEPRFRSHP